MAETTIIAGFMDLLAVPLDRHQRLDVLEAMARHGDWLSAEGVLLAAALLDHAARSRIDARALSVEQLAEVQATYRERREGDPEAGVARILDGGLALRQRPGGGN